MKNIKNPLEKLEQKEREMELEQASGGSTEEATAAEAESKA